MARIVFRAAACMTHISARDARGQAVQQIGREQRTGDIELFGGACAHGGTWSVATAERSRQFRCAPDSRCEIRYLTGEKRPQTSGRGMERDGGREREVVAP